MWIIILVVTQTFIGPFQTEGAAREWADKKYPNDHMIAIIELQKP